jgi:hypothetical protein
MIGRSGRPVANQFDIGDAFDSDGTPARFFQSYDSIIVKDCGGEITLDYYYWDYSRTTSKYRNQFLGETKAETQAKIDSGEYKLANLN